MTQHIEPIPAIFIREMKIKGVIKKEFLEYIESSVEYWSWRNPDGTFRKSPKVFLCSMSPSSRTELLDTFIIIRAMPDFPEDELLDNL